MTKRNPRALHLDHTDDRTRYRGLAHAHCNTTAGARRGGQVTASKTRGRPRPTATAAPSYRLGTPVSGDPVFSARPP